MKLPRVWILRPVKNQSFHACGQSVKQKNSTSTRVDGLSSDRTKLPLAWTVRQVTKQSFHVCGRSIYMANLDG